MDCIRVYLVAVVLLLFTCSCAKEPSSQSAGVEPSTTVPLKYTNGRHPIGTMSGCGWISFVSYEVDYQRVMWLDPRGGVYPQENSLMLRVCKTSKGEYVAYVSEMKTVTGDPPINHVDSVPYDYTKWGYIRVAEIR